MKNGNFSPESIDLFKELVRSDGGESNLTSDGENPFKFSLKTSSDQAQPIFAEVGQIRGEYIDNYDYTRCVRPNGTFYGTAGTCRLGTETDAKPKPESRVSKENYSWGTLIKVSNDPKSSSVILHPGDQEKVTKLKDKDTTSFTDEQGSKLKVTREGRDILMKDSKSGEEFRVPLKKLSQGPEKKFRSIPDQKLADMEEKDLRKLQKKYEYVLNNKGTNLSEKQKKFLISEKNRIKDFGDNRVINRAIREANDEKAKQRDLLKFRAKELQEKMDDAVTTREQGRISSAISDIYKRLQSDELKDRYSLSPEERAKVLGG